MWRSIFQSKWLTIIGVGLIVFLSLMIVKRVGPLEMVSGDVVSIKEKIKEMEQKQVELTSQERYSRSSAYLERQARLRLNYKKPGEEVVYVYRQDAQEKENQDLAKERGNLQQWWDYLLGD